MRALLQRVSEASVITEGCAFARGKFLVRA